MTGEQLNLLSEGWMDRTRLRNLAAYIDAAFTVGQILNPTYAAASCWPIWCHHKHPVARTPPSTLAWLQRKPWGPGEFLFRYVFTNLNGHVFDESAWCATEGGARGYLQRVTVPGTRERAAV